MHGLERHKEGDLETVTSLREVELLLHVKPALCAQ